MGYGKATDTGRDLKPFSLSQRLRSQREAAEAEEPSPTERESAVPACPRPEAQDGYAQLMYEQVRRVLEDFFKRARSLSACDTKALGKLAREITDEVLADKEAPPIDMMGRGSRHPFLWALFSRSEVADFIEHTLNVALLTAMLGAELGLGREELVRLTLTALLQNVGMLFLVPTLLNKRGGLWPDERALIQKHSETGAKFVRSLGPEWGPVADVIYQVHEREDGRGYPLGLKGGQIHEHAKIIGLADVYMALTHSRPFRPAFSPFEALREIIDQMEGQFPSRLIQTLWEVFSPFFKGRYILLNTGWVGRVKEAAGSSPMRPVVELLVNAAGERLEAPREMNLTENPMVFIKEVVSEERVKRLMELDVA